MCVCVYIHKYPLTFIVIANSFSRYLLFTMVPGTVLGSRDTVVSNTELPCVPVPDYTNMLYSQLELNAVKKKEAVAGDEVW